MRIHGHHGHGHGHGLTAHALPKAPAAGGAQANDLETAETLTASEPAENTTVDGDTFESTQPPATPPTEGSTPDPTTDPTTDTTTDPATQPPPESAPAARQPGVIRNLLAGHYHGVAALRLAIVHQVKLQAAIQGGATLPPPPGDPGHGAAYAKFRAAYDAIFAPPAPTPPPGDTTTPPVDDTTTPPVDDTTTPPVDDTTTPPVDDTTTPPVGDTTTPPVDETMPPDETAIDPNLPLDTAA